MRPPPPVEAPRVSVVLPTYGRPDLLDRAISTVVDQTFSDWELIVVDDNGAGTPVQEQTATVVAGMGTDPRVKYVVHEQNRGGGAARNTGIARAQGAFVAFLDDDDAWEPQKLERQLARFAEGPSEVALVYCRMRTVDERAGIVGTWQTDGASHSVRRLLERNTVGSTSAVMVRRQALADVGGFDESLPSKQDIDLYVRLAQLHEFAFVDEVLLTRYLHGGGSIGKNLDGTIRAHEIFYAKHRALIERDPVVERRRRLAQAHLLLQAKRRAEARALVWPLWRSRPFDVKAFGYLAMAYGIPWAAAGSIARRIGLVRARPAVEEDR